MNSKTLTLLGFCSKAGRMSYGMDATVASIKKGTAKLVVIAFDVSPKSVKEITFNTQGRLKIITLNDCDMQTLSHAIGRKCGILSVNDSGFAEAVEKVANKPDGK